MKSTISLDRTGRFVLPKAFRQRMNLREGDLLEIETNNEEIRIRRIMATPSRVIRKNGRAIWDAPNASSTAEAIEAALIQGREDRDLRASGL
jgi:AbrB family looped-hinge helix DNA binding protein